MDVPDVSAPYFGFDDDFSDLVAKRKLLPSSFSVGLFTTIKTNFK